MPYIVIRTSADEGSMTLRERVVSSDLESDFFCTHLVERLRWAVDDAQDALPAARSGSRVVA